MTVVWGSCVATWKRANDWLLPGLARNTHPDDMTILAQGDRIATVYNRILDVAPDGAHVVLLHDDTELHDGARDAILAGPGDINGCVGAANVRSLAWWDYDRSGAMGPKPAGTYGPVDVVDGLLIAMKPSATGLRFDEDYDGFHGYDADICKQAAGKGLDVATTFVPLWHHSTAGYGDRDSWDRANERWRTKWA